MDGRRHGELMVLGWAGEWSEGARRQHQEQLPRERLISGLGSHGSLASVIIHGVIPKVLMDISVGGHPRTPLLQMLRVINFYAAGMR